MLNREIENNKHFLYSSDIFNEVVMKVFLNVRIDDCELNRWNTYVKHCVRTIHGTSAFVSFCGLFVI